MPRRIGLPLLAATLLSPTPLAAQVATRPAIFPAPAELTLGAGTMTLGRHVVLIAAPGTDPATAARAEQVLRAAGVETITAARRLDRVPARVQIVLGLADATLVRTALGDKTPDTAREGYTITIAPTVNTITLAGSDGDGLFHAVQTLRQLVQRPALPALMIRDHPAMPVRGTIEGFYGKPWTMAERTRHLDFLATVKANTYVYSPKDDPYARDRWREAYPAATLTQLGTLAAAAARNHVDFVYAISPGPTICFSAPADLQALRTKFDALRGIGIHRFYVALDDIEYKKWNCDADQAAFGPSGAAAAGKAQAQLLNAVQADLTRRDPKAPPLIMVPTEYYDAKDTPYKAALRDDLDPKVVVQWTGTDVVPPAISIPDARAATRAFGRKTLLWDNYPVNDYAQTTGRLLMAPYTRREAGLAGELTGILSNPMNQEAPSRVAVTGVLAFAWNDTAYDAQQTWHWSARELAGGDARATAALLTFFDTQHMAPTFGSQPWQEQAPRLHAVLTRVREAVANGDAATRTQAIAELTRVADDLAAAPDTIRAGAADATFVEQARPWFDALALWGRALQQTAAGLAAADAASSAAARYFADARRLAGDAAAVRTIPGATRFDGPIRIADGVLDRFIADAPGLIGTTIAR
ncbi:beta-N-acetylglucosaminidase domain-containing protein [Sphingomonas sp. 8AM]|uniref:beta-N-acetylglucosaminidase domain-containing protein n=1 Tax=Sphingomonas sp. 8AM TaxID=2653170 RepID=UPI0012F2A761|nr:beta-N-acetylglucosaminidase domain-containing protein [Sphingomonas sp. 8AM]VXC45643.1 Beta-N-acetylglucosaminidase [Sphingomonas sp. 8AM]